MKRALDILNLSKTFDTEVTAARITKGKPNPSCYLLAAEDLNASPSECVVFEDSFHGIRAGKDAGMRVVGVSTTIPENELQDKADFIISDFSDLKQVLLSISTRNKTIVIEANKFISEVRFKI